MKKVLLAIMVAVITVNSFAQNQQTNPETVTSLNDVFMKKPFWTTELSGGFGYRAETYWQSVTQIGGGNDTIPYLGIDVTAKPYFYSIPRITAGFSNLFVSAAFYFDVNNNSTIMPDIATYGIGFFNQNIHAAGKFAEIGVTFIADAFTYNNKVYIDFENVHSGANLFFIENNLKLSMNNVSAYIATLASWDGTLTNITFADLIVTNAWLSLKDIFSCISILAGSTDFSFLRINSLFAPSAYKERILEYAKSGFFIAPFVTQQLRAEKDYYYGMTGYFTLTSIDGMTDVVTLASTIPILSTIALQKPFKLPLTIYVYTPLPEGPISFARYFNAYNVTVALAYEITGVGTIDAGWVSGIGYTIPGITQILASWYSPVHYHDNNVFFIDAKLNFTSFKELTVVTGSEFILSTFYNSDVVSGAGTQTDPFVRAIVNSFEINYGLEIAYQADALLKNLSFGAGLYINYGTGKNYQNMNTGTETFDQQNAATYPTATWVLLNSYTEENYIQRMYYENYPVSIFFKAGYTFSNFSVSLQNLFIKLRGLIDGGSTWWNETTPGVKRPRGFYDTDTLTVSGTYTEGMLSLTAALSYTFFMGLPTITDLGYTDAIAQGIGYYNADALYKDRSPDIVKYPWNITIIYKLKY